MKVPKTGLSTSQAYNWTAQQTFSAIVKLEDDVALVLGSSDDTALDWSTAEVTSDTLIWGLGTSSKSLVLTDIANVASSHDHAGQTNPTIFVHSAKDPDTANDEWTSITHDGTDGVLATGSGALKVTSQGLFTALPTGGDVGQGSLYVNPASAGADNTLFGVALNGSARFWIDEDGDVQLDGTERVFLKQIHGRSTIPLSINSSVNQPINLEQKAVNRLINMGLGSQGTITLAANLDQNDVSIIRDVDGDSSTYSEDGANLFLSRSISDVSNAVIDGGNYAKFDDVFRVDGLGHVIIAEAVRLKESGGHLYVRNLADTANYKLQASYVVGSSALSSGLITDRYNIGGGIMIGGQTRISDAAPGVINLTGQGARTSATTNKVGGPLILTGGAGGGAAGQEEADGAYVLIMGGDAAALNLSDGGHVLIGGGANGSTGDDGAVKLGDGVAETNYVNIATDGTLSLVGNARKTKHIVISDANLGKGASAASEVIIGNFAVWEFGISDDAVLTEEMLPDWAVGTDIEIHVHWQCNEAYVTNSGEVQWQVDWSALPHDNTESIAAPTHTGTLDSGDVNIPAIARYLTSTQIGTISGASLAAEDSLGLTLSRVALDGGANPAAEPGILHLEIHYVCDKLGEA